MLEISNLHVTVDGVAVLQGVSLGIPMGQTHLLMGHNGAGKSTLGWVIAGHEGYVVTAGSITLGGEDLLALPPEERAQAGVFLGYQHPVAFPGLTVVQFLREVLEAQQRKAGQPIDAIKTLKQIRAACKEVGVPETWLKRSLNDAFSGGEKKRMELLQMKLLQPRFAILDEYDSGLDIDSTKELSRFINDQRSPERAMLLISHSPRAIDYLDIDRVHIISDGKIVRSGSVDLVSELVAAGYTGLEAEAPAASQLAK